MKLVLSGHVAQAGLEFDDDVASISGKDTDEVFGVASSVLRLVQALRSAHFNR